MSGASIALFFSVFLASAVEAVEAVTIVLAAGTSRDWKSALRGTFAGLIVLGGIIAIAGPALSHLPISDLRLAVGGLLLVFGLQWLRKAILRASGYKALHDEEKIYLAEIAAAKAAGKVSRTGVDDWYAFTLSFKGVLLEGLEVAFIVLTFGTIQHQVGLASIAALAAVLIAAGAGFAIRKPLSRVPENNMKFTVGVLLTAFGIFWGTEGSGVKWPGDSLAVPVLIAFVAAMSFVLISLLKVQHVKVAVNVSNESAIAKSEVDEEIILEQPNRGFVTGIKAFGAFWYDFIIGDDWRIAAGIVLSFFLVAALKHSGNIGILIIPAATISLLSLSLFGVVKSSKRQNG
jgi:uncharacterized membrane protein